MGWKTAAGNPSKHGHVFARRNTVKMGRGLHFYLRKHMNRKSEHAIFLFRLQFRLRRVATAWLGSDRPAVLWLRQPSAAL